MKLNYYEKKIYKQIAAMTAFFIIAIFVIWQGYKGGLKPEIEDAGTWFQRCGSILILLAIFAELLVVKRLKSITELGENEARKRFSKSIKTSNALVIIIGFVGTVIWGYGDLIWKLST